jgi:S-(hydroxymethyl)glutathione dehydrogenase/alcohol dehydrogenase
VKATAAILWEAGEQLEVREIDVAGPKAGEVEVEIAAAGLCHSDLSMIGGNIPQQLPAVPGHEAAGIVSGVGPGVDSVVPGDHVVLIYRPYCGRCYQCSRGRPGLCSMAAQVRGSGLMPDGTSRLSADGTELFHFSGVSAFSERAVVPESGVIKVDSDLPLDILAVVGCAVMTGYGAVINAAELRPGESALVIGAGGVGLNSIQGARISGANPIIAVDRSVAALGLAKEMGATHVINPDEEDVAEAVKRISGEGVDYVFEAVGAGPLIELGLDLLRPGGAVIVIGAPPLTASVSLSPLRLLSEEKSLIGSLYGSSNFRLDLPRIVGLWKQGDLKIDALVRHHFPLAEVNDGLAAMEAGLEGRAVLEMAERG